MDIQIFKIKDPLNLRFLYPGYSVLERPPLFGGDKGIYTSEFMVDRKEDYPESIFVSSSRGLDLDKRENLITLIHKRVRALADKERQLILTCDESDLWHIVGQFYLTHKMSYYFEQESSTYELLKSLSESPFEVVKAVLGVEGVPVPILFSSMLTFLIKMKNLDEIREIINPVYAKDLERARKSIRNVQSAIMWFVDSTRSQADFLHFMLELKGEW